MSIFVLTLLVIEFIDELAYGARETAWPLIRADLGLTYAEIGLLMGLPIFASTIIEPILSILSDIPGWRRRVILVGGLAFVAELMMVALATNGAIILLAYLLFSPFAGVFVSLSQAALMDIAPERHEQNMARWTLFGAAAIVVAPIMLSVILALGGSWRIMFVLSAVLTLAAWLALRVQRFPQHHAPDPDDPEAMPTTFAQLIEGFRGAFRALRRGRVFRWLVLLDFADLMMDVLYGYLALYFVDVVGVNEGQAALGIAIWTGVGLVGDVLLIPLLERVRGLTYLRFSAVVNLFLFPAFLLIPGFEAKVIVLGVLGVFNAGWYSVLQAQVYSAMPGQSGAAAALSSIFGVITGLLPLGIGIAAQLFTLENAMWLMLLGPIALLIGIPRRAQDAV